MDETNQESTSKIKLWWENATEEQKQNRLKPMQEAARHSTTRSTSIQASWDRLTQSEKTAKALPGSRAGSARQSEDDVRKKKSASSKAFWNSLDDDEKEKRTKHLHTIVSSSLETAMENLLCKEKIEYVTQKYFRLNNGRGCLVDFYLPERNIIIEVDGEHWHNLPHRKLRDQELDAHCKAYDIDIAHVKDKEIELYGIDEALWRAMQRASISWELNEEEIF